MWEVGEKVEEGENGDLTPGPSPQSGEGGTAESGLTPRPPLRDGEGENVNGAVEAEDDLDISIGEEGGDEVGTGPEPCDDAPERLVMCATPSGSPRVFLAYVAVKQMLAHARSDTTREIGGVLYGRQIKSRHGLCTVVTGALEAKDTEAGVAHVTFSHDTWNDIYRRLDEHGDDAKIVGWYHSHPGFGIFLSNQDMFIQRNFFTAPGQIAIVVDPIGNRWGQFRWRDEQVKPSGGFWVYAEQEEQVEAAKLLVASLGYALHVPPDPTVLDKMMQPFASLADGVAGLFKKKG